jgi:hypothetical protein
MFYNLKLKIVQNHETLSEPARDRSEALNLFGKKRAVSLTFEDNNTVVQYLFGESAKNPHWVSCTIPVYVTRPSANE